MSNITVRFIGDENAADINIKNERFRLWGRMVPNFQNGEWGYTAVENEKSEWQVFPNENYSYDDMKNDFVFIGAYDGDECVGLAILQKTWHKYLYLYDIKVNEAYRGRHVGTEMIQKACDAAKEAGLRGIRTVAQDTNLSACLFYLHNGFRIGGVDTGIYNGTKQEGKSDIFFYKELDN